MPGKLSCTESSPKRVWILGGGKFGRHALDHFTQGTKNNFVVVVDNQEIGDLPDGVEHVCADGVEWLVEHLTPHADAAKILPVLPLHLAAEWVKRKLSEQHAVVDSVAIPDELLCSLPHPIRLRPDQVTLSHADFICPPNCSEPEELCLYTRKKRPKPLYKLLAAMNCGNFVPLVIQSRQFAPGLGGFFPDDLWHLLERTRLLPNTPLLIGTACKCHGIVDSIYHSLP